MLCMVSDYAYLMAILWLYPLMLETADVPGLSQKGLWIHHRLWLVSSQQLLLITLTTTPVLLHHRDLSGTAISLLQHPTQQFPGTPRAVTVIDNNLQGQRALSTLPDASPDPLVPPVAASVQQQPPTELNQLNSVSSWLTNTKDTLLKPELQENDIVSWAVYNSSEYKEHPHPVTPAYLLPLFPEAAHSVAMIFHAMNVVKAVVVHLNPGQVPVLVAYQPLFLIAKKIQWNYPQIFGEEQFVVFLGGMQVEMMASRLLGNWQLDSSGWTTAIINSGVAAGGTADSLLAESPCLQ